jgi:hypothetical protein
MDVACLGIWYADLLPFPAMAIQVNNYVLRQTKWWQTYIAKHTHVNDRMVRLRAIYLL